MYRTIIRQLRRTRVSPAAAPINALHQNPSHNKIPIRSYAFNSAEEAAAERRQRKRRQRIEPPKWALNSASSTQQPRQYRDDGQPDSTSRLVGKYLSLHNRVQSLIRAGDLDSASAVARQSVFSHIRPTVFTCNAIISAMHRANRHKDAISLFHYFFDQNKLIPNVSSYNTLISAHFGNSGDVDAAMETYNRILEKAPFSPSSFTYRNLTKGLVEVGRIDDAVDMLREMLNKGQGADSLVYNNLISGFLELGNVERANEFFEELQEKCTVFDGVVSASFMEYYFKQGKKKEAMEAYRYLMSKGFRLVPATSNVVLGVLVKYGMESEAWSFFKKRLDDHTPPSFNAVNSDTFNMMVNECFRLGDVEKAVEVFKMEGQGKTTKAFAMDTAGFSNMIARMCEVDRFEEAEGYFEALRKKSLPTDVTTYRTFIEAYVRTGKVDEALDKYRDMVVAELRVIPEYANKWFGFLVENDKVKECVPVLMKMCERDPKPHVTTFEVVMKGLCESDELDGCLYVLTQMRKNRVHVTPGLREYLSSVFEKHGKLEAVKSILDTNFPPPQIPDFPVPAWFEALESPPKDGFLAMFPKKDGPSEPAKPDLRGSNMPWQFRAPSQMPKQAPVGNLVNAQVPGASHWQQEQRSEGQSQNSGQDSSAIQFPRANSQIPRQDTYSSQSQWQQGSVTPPQGHSQNSSANQFPGATSQPPVAPSQWQQGHVPPQNSWQNSSANQFPGASSQWEQKGSVSPQNSWQNSSTNQFPNASSQSSVGAPSQWQQKGSVSPQNSWQTSSANQFPNASSQSSVGATSQWQQNGSVSPQNSWQNSSANQFPGASSQSSVGAPSQWQQNGSEGQRSAGWRPSSANQFPGANPQTPYPSSSQVPWQASVPSRMNQNPSTSYNPHQQGQSGRYPQSWVQTSQPQMPQQAAAASPSEMPYDAVRYHMAK